MFAPGPAPDADVAVDSSPAATPLATIELTDCVARGEAVFLCVEDLQPVYLLWENGLLATTEQLLTAGGGQVAPKPDEMLRLELRHLTAAVRGGLCRLSATPANPYQLTVQFACTDDIILTAPRRAAGRAGGRRQRGQIPPAVRLERRPQLLSRRGRVLDGAATWIPQVAPESMTFEGWKTHWGPSRENQPSREPLAVAEVAERRSAVARPYRGRLFSGGSDVQRRIERRPRLSRPSSAAASPRVVPRNDPARRHLPSAAICRKTGLTTANQPASFPASS